MKYTLLIYLFIFHSFVYSQTIQDFKTSLKYFSKDNDLKNASIGFYAFDLNSNEELAELNAEKSLIPASINKLITTATALEILGAETKFSTQLLYSGEIDTIKHVLNGNIIIKGGGDPCLGSYRFEKHYGDFINNWAQKIKDLGIDSVNGKVIGDATCFSVQNTPSTWIWGDLGNYYGASPSGLSIYENMCRVQFVSGTQKGDSTVVSCVSPYVPGFEIDNDVLSISTNRDQSYFFGAPYQTNRLVKGGIPMNKESFEVKSSIPDPAFLASFELDMELRNLGVRIAETNTTIRISEFDYDVKLLSPIMETYSPPLKQIIEQTNLYSVNLYAEHLLNQIALKVYKSGDTESGTTAVTNFWKEKGMDIDGFYMNDGSGLSRFDVFTPKQLAFILNYMYTSNNKKIFTQSLPVAGKSGTIRNIGKKTFAEGNLKAKSGYMTRVRSYAGYVTTKSNREVCFVLMINNYNSTPYEMKKKMEKVMVKLSEITD